MWACCLWKCNDFLKTTWLLRRSYTEGKEMQESSGIVKNHHQHNVSAPSHHSTQHRRPAIDGRPSSITYLHAPLRIRSENCPAPLRTRSEKSFGGGPTEPPGSQVSTAVPTTPPPLYNLTNDTRITALCFRTKCSLVVLDCVKDQFLTLKSLRTTQNLGLDCEVACRTPYSQRGDPVTT